MKYFFILGKNRALSAAEIKSLAPSESDFEFILDNVLLMETRQDLDFKSFFKSLGGSVKGGEILQEAAVDFWPLPEQAAEYMRIDDVSGKYKFGFSLYGFNRNMKNWAMRIKQILKEKGVSSRWVSAKTNDLSSVVVRTNKLDGSKGIDLCFFRTDERLYIGSTRQAQEFKKWSKRDYGRPARDDLSGMLPPKLARIMLNLAGAEPGKKLLDPFCGSGTILSEAAMLGLTDLSGSDISEKALLSSRENIDWLRQEIDLGDLRLDLQKADAKELSRFFPEKRFQLIVFEPYLGPARGQQNYRQVSVDLAKLYSAALAELYKIAESDCRLVMVTPVFLPEKHSIETMPDFGPWSVIGFNLKRLSGWTGDNNLIYGRPGQKLWRRIIVLQK